MMELYLPWLELAVLLPLVGAAVIVRFRDVEQAQRWSLLFCGLALLCSLGAWQDFHRLHADSARDGWALFARFLGGNVFIIDDLSAPLFALAALLYLITALATLRTKVRRFSFAGMLVSEAILLATLSCKEPWLIIALLALGTIPPWLELRARKKPVRVYVLHMGLFVFLMVAGWLLMELDGGSSLLSTWAIVLLTAAVLLRCGIVPVHCWMTDLFEHAALGTALLFVTPMIGVYAAVRLVLPVAPDWILQSMAVLSLFTAVYSAGMALVQKEARRFFCYLFLSNSSLVLVGLEIATPIGLTGALCVWISIGLALGGFGLTLRSMESRLGRLSLADFHGMYEKTPALAAFFLLTGLASIGFPGTIGFVALELLIDGVVQPYPFVGTAMVIAAALNGIAVLQAYLHIFTGTRRASTIDLFIHERERVAVLTLTMLILAGGLWPQPGVTSRYNAALEIIESRRSAPTNTRQMGHQREMYDWSAKDEEGQRNKTSPHEISGQHP